MSITLYGNSDTAEEDASLEDMKFMNLGQKRINAVKAYLVSKGIAATRIKQKNNRDQVPVSENGDELSQAKNRRVEIKFNN